MHTILLMTAFSSSLYFVTPSFIMSDSALNALAGAAAGVIAMIGTYPLNLLSTRAAVVETNSKLIYHTLSSIIKQKRLRVLYSGLGSSVLGIAVNNGVYYYFYEGVRNAISGGKKAMSTTESMLAGLIAGSDSVLLCSSGPYSTLGSAATIISNPIWVIQTMQAIHGTKEVLVDTEPTDTPGMVEMAKYLIASDGLQALWAGVGPALVLVINPIIQYTVFEQLKKLMITSPVDPKEAAAVLSDSDYFVLGALSKFIATGITYPYMVVRTRLQSGKKTRCARRYMASLHTIVRTEGIKGLYRGVGTKTVQSVLAAAITFAAQRRIFEFMKMTILESRYI
ncbi:Mitochondrial carrier [Mycena venus]|uniref:Mitochondrial carrier n=1 Tax=Mycena venus TaxID=2733690 RepID=A0A8H7CQ36_9AGAR|nr:Mitochondrial carrier [Mycena venus]